MKFSPCRTWLYRNRLSAVIWATLILLAGAGLVAQGPITQYGRKPKADLGPRALGLIQLSPKGNKGRLIPIVIMMDGKFYDAGSYKAMPVPMALDFDVVYEGLRTGVSQGIFTITQPGQLKHAWIAEGTWLPAGAKAPEKHKKYSAPVIEDKDAPPVLHRRSEKTATDGGTESKDKEKDKDKDKDQQKPLAPPASKPSAPETAKAPAPEEAAKTSTSDEPIEDPNRPRLRRGKPSSSPRREPFTTFDALTDTAPGASSTSSGKADTKGPRNTGAFPQIVTIPAISDAGGPDPRPYTYDVKPAEEAIYRNKMFALAAAQLRAQAGAAAKEAVPSRKKSISRKSGKLTTPSPGFDDVTLRIFDLSNSNEPVLVLSAKTRPPAAGAAGSIEEPKEITLIARTNLEGEVQKLFFAQTDSRHLDLTPRMELIDAVDADGDGRGELLFQRTFDGGSAYAIYRVTADGLWPLFEGTP